PLGCIGSCLQKNSGYACSCAGVRTISLQKKPPSYVVLHPEPVKRVRYDCTRAGADAPTACGYRPEKCGQYGGTLNPVKHGQSRLLPKTASQYQDDEMVQATAGLSDHVF